MLSCIWLFGTPWTVACQAPLSMEFSQEPCWSGLSFPPLEDLPNPGIELVSPALAGQFFTTELPGKPSHMLFHIINTCVFVLHSGQNWDWNGKTEKVNTSLCNSNKTPVQRMIIFTWPTPELNKTHTCVHDAVKIQEVGKWGQHIPGESEPVILIWEQW